MNYLTMNNAYAKNTFLQPETQQKMLFSENNNQISPDKTIQEVWSKYNFETNNVSGGVNLKTSWATDKIEEEVKVDDEEEEEAAPKEKEEETSPSHHARRPMNAFLIFCKKHRPIVRERFPNLENRGVTRILGEWWALLDEKDKAPYTGLAKEYKDAFLSANPGFKWYKLPAPPLRTLNVRPVTHKILSPVSSPNHNVESEFTPGKLADESQLGSLTSLMNNNFVTSKIEKTNENNNNTLEKNVNSKETPLPLKPFKKRIFDGYPDNNSNITNLDISDGSHMTNQDLMDKVVDKIFTKPEQDEDDSYHKEIRKSGRQCKGKRYEKFMVEGRLLGHKRDGKLTSQRIDNSDLCKIDKPEPETPNLDYTIKRLAERTNMKGILENQKSEEKNDRIRIETQDTSFNLNLRINNLPSLSYDVFHQRKRESKKRKNRIKSDEPKSKVVKVSEKNDQLVGSKKRKNKMSITHLKEEVNVGCDLMALATLAEIAANTEKINSE